MQAEALAANLAAWQSPAGAFLSTITDGRDVSSSATLPWLDGKYDGLLTANRSWVALS